MGQVIGGVIVAVIYNGVELHGSPARSGNPGTAVRTRESWARVIRQARCGDSNLDADEWFPVSTQAQRARVEAAAAIAICQACPVRSQCLALSLRHWDIGQYGVWGGLIAADRAILRRRMPEPRRRPLASS